MASGDPKVLVTRQGRVVEICLNDPATGNALSLDLVRQLVAAVEGVDTSATGALLLRGNGPSFCTGGYLDKTAATAFDPELLELGQRLVRSLMAAPPAVAAIHGWAVGGGLEITLACEVRIASDDARFRLPECRLGMAPASGSTVLLPHLIGGSAARALVLTGATRPSGWAEQVGLVAEVTGQGQLLERAGEIAANIAGMPPEAVRTTRALLHAPLAAALEEALHRELAAANELAGGPAALRSVSEFRATRRTEDRPS